MYKISATLACCKFKKLNREKRFGGAGVGWDDGTDGIKICGIISTLANTKAAKMSARAQGYVIKEKGCHVIRSPHLGGPSIKFDACAALQLARSLLASIQ